MLKMAFASTRTAHILALVRFMIVMELVSKKQLKMQQSGSNSKGTSGFSQEQTPLSLLNRFNETYNKADYINTYVLVCADTHCE